MSVTEYDHDEDGILRGITTQGAGARSVVIQNLVIVVTNGDAAAIAERVRAALEGLTTP